MQTCLIGGQSFSAGIKVLTASGALVAISKLKPGDKVLATSTTGSLLISGGVSDRPVGVA